MTVDFSLLCRTLVRYSVTMKVQQLVVIGGLSTIKRCGFMFISILRVLSLFILSPRGGLVRYNWSFTSDLWISKGQLAWRLTIWEVWWIIFHHIFISWLTLRKIIQELSCLYRNTDHITLPFAEILFNGDGRRFLFELCFDQVWPGFGLTYCLECRVLTRLDWPIMITSIICFMIFNTWPW